MKGMKNIIVALLSLVTVTSFAGNKDRSGEAGASELLINPWARSSGLAGSNSAYVIGLEAINTNVAGLAFTQKTELLFAHTRYLSGTGIGINSFGFSQKLGESNVIGVSVMSMNFGEIERTTTNLPEGGIGTFKISYSNIGISYAKEFSNSIYGGATVKVVSEGISNARSSGVALDAGIRYVTGEYDQIKFGIALRNVGPPMKFSGDGLTVKNETANGQILSQSQKSAQFEMPSLLNIGGSYDFYFNSTVDSATYEIKSDHKLTVGMNFTSNSFTKDQIRVGAEYAFMSKFMIRGGYMYEQGIFNAEERTQAHTGPTAGFSIELPLNKAGSSFSLDYGYQFSNPWSGSHTIGARINL
jgi:hypothetical protein